MVSTSPVTNSRKTGNRSLLSIAVILSVALMVLAGHSSGAVVTASESLANYGTFGQQNSAVTFSNTLAVGPYACAPTSAANSLTYLVNTYNLTGVVQSGYTTVNSLAQNMGTVYDGTNAPNNGTTDENAVSGLNSYIAAQGVSSEISITDLTNPQP